MIRDPGVRMGTPAQLRSHGYLTMAGGAAPSLHDHKPLLLYMFRTPRALSLRPHSLLAFRPANCKCSCAVARVRVLDTDLSR